MVQMLTKQSPRILGLVGGLYYFLKYTFNLRYRANVDPSSICEMYSPNLGMVGVAANARDGLNCLSQHEIGLVHAESLA